MDEARMLSRLDQFYSYSNDDGTSPCKEYINIGGAIGLDHLLVYFSISLGEHQQRKNNFKMSSRYLGDPEVLDGITHIRNEEFRGKSFFHKFQQTQRYYRQYCKGKMGKWRENEIKLRQEVRQATTNFHHDT